MTDGPFGKKLLGQAQGQEPGGPGLLGAGLPQRHQQQKPITKAEDLAGLKIRVIQSPIYIDMFNALGANAVPVPFPELYTALEQRPWTGRRTSHHHPLVQIQRSAKAPGHHAPHVQPAGGHRQQRVLGWPVARSKAKWINDAMAEATTFQRRLARCSQWRSDQLKKSGMQVMSSCRRAGQLRAKMKCD